MIRAFFSRWRPRHLLLAWAAYWLALILVKLAPALSAAWRMSRHEGHGSANISVADGGITASILEPGRAAWSGSISLTHLALLVTLPPLLLWIVWLAASSRTNNAGEMGLKSRSDMRELHAAEHRIGIIDNSSPSPSKRREREES